MPGGGEVKERAGCRSAESSRDNELLLVEAEQTPGFLAEQSCIDDVVDRMRGFHPMMLEEKNKFAMRLGFPFAD